MLNFFNEWINTVDKSGSPQRLIRSARQSPRFIDLTPTVRALEILRRGVQFNLRSKGDPQ